MRKIPVSGPSITQKEIDLVTEAVTTAWYDKANVYHDRFEQAFAAYVGTRHAVALPSCTSALHLALLALGVGPGDEVVVPDLTWIASVAPVHYVGATPVFADADPETWCMTGRTFEACLTPRTKAVIPVDLYGGMAEMDAIRRVAEAHGVAVVEDAAEAIGSSLHGRQAGAWGDVGTFSFHGSKTLTTGEGGMLVTDRDDLHQRVLFLRDHGRKPGDKLFWNTEVAYKYKMSSMQAALGLAQLERIDELVAGKRQIFAWYQEGLADVAGLVLNAEPSGTLNTYWMVTVLWPAAWGLSKDELMARLGERGVDSRPFFHPLSSLPAFAEHPEAAAARARNRVSYDLSPRGLNLPSGLNLTREDVAAVCRALKASLAR
ncbi:MAG: DegT/DnrJ/EryC1/StrS family aminotransferase [Candidatus Sericytochromatia bacterium]